MERYPFVIIDESVLTSYGFRIMAAGGKIDNYKNNPLVLWMHRRPGKWKESNKPEEEVFPIGLAYNVRKDGGKWIADVEFDQNDAFAKKIESKVKSGHIRMASPGIEPIAWSESADLLLTGQRAATLVEWELTEISICDIGSTPTALKLYNNNKQVIELNAGNQADFIPQLAVNKNHNNKSMEFLNRVAVMLGLDPNTAETEVVKVLNSKLELARTGEDYKGKYDTLLNEVTLAAEQNIITLVESNIDKKITADQREKYTGIGKTLGLTALRTMFENLPEIKGPSKTITFSKKPEANADDLKDVKTLDDLKSKGVAAVELMKKENPAQYIELFKTEYGFEPSLD